MNYEWTGTGTLIPKRIRIDQTLPSSWRVKFWHVLVTYLAFLLMAFGAQTSYAAPADFNGIIAEDVTKAEDSTMLTDMKKIRANGSGIIRQTFDWSLIEPSKGQFNFEQTDRIVGNAASSGIKILPILFNPPAWASSAPSSGAKKGTYPPKNAADMADFAKALVQRYGPNGTFWSSAHDGRSAIKSWQVWNEPNLKVYWPTGPSPKGYVKLLKPVYKAIKALDPSAEVLAAGLPNSKIGTPFKTFAKGIYIAGGKPYFTTFSLHAYSSTDRGVVEAVRSTRKIIKHYRDNAKIWVTEIGWATNAPGKSPFETTGKGQAQRISRTIRKLCKQRIRLGVRGIVYFGWRDVEPYNNKKWWGLNTGLQTRSGKAKPALKAYRSAAKSC